MVVTILVLIGGTLAWLRWLRVVQREHYVPGSATQFAVRWWKSRVWNELAIVLAVGGLVGSFWRYPLALIPGIVVAAGPLGLGLRGRTSPLNWTRRLRYLAVTSAVISLLFVVVGWFVGIGVVVTAAIALLIPVIIDLAAFLLIPFENRLARGFVEQAALRLARVQPIIVGITGSYGKTSTKEHLAALINGDFAVVPSPRSFNNRAGLARAINEHLSDGTQIFIAEMGTYGPGEIADLVSWCPPKIAIMTAIGPVHLERFGTLETTVKAKSEILEPAELAILNVDEPLLEKLADSVGDRCGVVRVSSLRRDVDVAVIAGEQTWEIILQGSVLGTCEAPIGLQPTNVACAIAAAQAVGVDPQAILHRVRILQSVQNRLTIGQGSTGVQIIDDTFNANPAGAAAALSTLMSVPCEGKRVVVTPGMIELGELQFNENERFGEQSASLADVVIVVGRTNKKALLHGAARHEQCTVISVSTRDDAVAWVRANLTGRDVVLYENDFPDHYP